MKHIHSEDKLQSTLKILGVLGCAIFVGGCFAPAPRFTSASPTPREHSTASPVSIPPADDAALSVSEGIASYYGDEFNGRKTSSGEIFDKDKLTAAHLTYTFGTRLRVVNLDNGRECVVTVNDRGPFAANRIVDLSYGAAVAIGMIGTGTAHVRLEVLAWGK